MLRDFQIIYGIDTGFASIKAVDNESQVIIPAIFAPFKKSDYIINNDDNLRNIAVEYSNQRFFIGESSNTFATAQQTLDMAYYTSPRGVAATLVALLHLSQYPKYVKCKTVLGLPVAQFAAQKSNYSVAVKGRHFMHILNLDGSIRSDHCIDITDVAIIPQPVGSFFGVMLDKYGAIIDDKLPASRVGVIDIGGHTVDVARVDNMQFVSKLSGSYSDVGCYQILKQLCAEISNAHGITMLPEKLSVILGPQGLLKIRGKNQDVSSLRRKAAAGVAEIIISRLKNMWPDLWEMDRIMLAGGGAYLMADAIAAALDPGRSGQVDIVDDPVMANVRGYYRLGQRLWRKK